MQGQQFFTSGKSSTTSKSWQDYAKGDEDITNPKVIKQCKDRMRKQTQKAAQKSKKGTRLMIALYDANQCFDSGVIQCLHRLYSLMFHWNALPCSVNARRLYVVVFRPGGAKDVVNMLKCRSSATTAQTRATQTCT